MEKISGQNDRAISFLSQHHAPEVLVLPNAWDAASAMIFVHEGFRAIGTTSAGIAASLGYADGERMTSAENLEVTRRIINQTDLPVSVDFESGYAHDADGVARGALALIQAGAVGLNIEDSPKDSQTALSEISHQQDKIQAIRETAESVGVRMVINARTDAYLLGDTTEKSLRESIKRGNAYVAAGADCVFVPDMGNLGSSDIKCLAAEIDAPINVIAGASMPGLAKLQELGVSRVSLGPRPMRAVLGLLREIAREIRSQGSFELMSNESISYAEVNSWFSD